MAGAEKLIEKILGDAQQEAERLWHEAELKKKAMHEELERSIEKQRAQIEKDAEDAIQEKKRRLSAVYDLEYRKQVLAAKQEMMGRAKAFAMEKLLRISDSDYVSLMKKRLLACASGKGSIAVSAGETRLNSEFLADVNAVLKSQGKGTVTFSPERRDIAGGFVYIEGGMEIDVSLEALLSEAWERSETDVAAVLFE